MNPLVLILSAVLFILSVILTVFAVRAIVRSRWEQKERFFVRLGRLHRDITQLKLAHPVLSGLGSQWTPGTMARVYYPSPPGDTRWIHYYSLVELCLSYCNTALYAKNRKIIGNTAFRKHYEPFMKHIFTEHRPIIEDLVREDKRISLAVKAYCDALP